MEWAFSFLTKFDFCYYFLDLTACGTNSSEYRPSITEPFESEAHQSEALELEHDQNMKKSYSFLTRWNNNRAYKYWYIARAEHFFDSK